VIPVGKGNGRGAFLYYEGRIGKESNSSTNEKAETSVVPVPRREGKGQKKNEGRKLFQELITKMTGKKKSRSHFPCFMARELRGIEKCRLLDGAREGAG